MGILMVASIFIKPGQEPAYFTHIKILRRHALKYPGCMSFRLLECEDDSEPRNFMSITEWVDETSLNQYLSGPHLAKYADDLRDSFDPRTMVATFRDLDLDEEGGVTGSDMEDIGESEG